MVLGPTAVEGMIDAAEDGVGVLRILGRAVDDDSGRYYEISGIGDPIGMSVVCEGGGTDPDDGTVATFIGSFRDGVLAVIDPYAGEFSLFVSEDGVLRKASAIIRE